MLYAEKNGALISIELEDALVFIQAGYTIKRPALYSLTKAEVLELLNGTDSMIDTEASTGTSSTASMTNVLSSVNHAQSTKSDSSIDVSRIVFSPVAPVITFSREPVLHEE